MSAPPTPTAGSRHPARVLLAAALVAASLVGLVGFHLDEHPAARSWDDQVLAGGLHPHQPAHVERPEGRRHRACPGCLFQLTLQGGEVGRAASLADLRVAEAPVAQPRQIAAAAPYSPLSSRGPPRA